MKLLFILLLLSSQAFALTEAEGIRLLRKTHSYVDESLLKIIQEKDRHEAARFIVEREGTQFKPIWHSDIESFNRVTHCLKKKKPKTVKCDKEESFYKEQSYKYLKALIPRIDISSFGSGKRKLEISDKITFEEYEDYIASDKKISLLINGIMNKTVRHFMGSSYIEHILEADNFFYENLVLFWSNHFVTTKREVSDYIWMSNQNNLIRKMMFSNFKDFVKAITIDPAMIKFLNLDENHCISRRQKYDCSSINENYARELLELFTLGADSQTGKPICYTEDDIETISKALTGHTANKVSKEYSYKKHRSDFKFLEKKYPVKKAFLEKCDAKELGVIPAVSTVTITDTDSLIETLFERRGKQIARHITEKLYNQFVSPKIDWSDKEIQNIALKFSKDFNLKDLTVGLLASKAIYKESSRNTIIKSPAELYFGTLRQLKIKETKNLVRHMKNAKQEMFQQPDVKGWRTGKGWIDTASFAARTLFVRRALSGNRKSLCERVQLDKLKKYMLEGQQVTKHKIPKNLNTCAKKMGQLQKIASDPIYQVK